MKDTDIMAAGIERIGTRPLRSLQPLADFLEDTMTDATRLIRASLYLLDVIGTRTEDGRRLTVEWGNEVAYIAETGEYIYEPTFTATDDGMALIPTEELAGLRTIEEAARDANPTPGQAITSAPAIAALRAALEAKGTRP